MEELRKEGRGESQKGRQSSSEAHGGREEERKGREEGRERVGGGGGEGLVE